MLPDPLTLALLAQMGAEDILNLEQSIFLGLLASVILLVLNLTLILIWRARVRRRG